MSSGNINTTRSNFGNIRSHFQHRYSGVLSSGENHNSGHHQEKKTYSLTQKSITNFFRSRSKKSGSGGGGGGSKTAGGGEKEDDDDDEMINYGPEGNSMMTFKDITTFGYKQGDKFGVSSDTTPIIPTLMTTSQVKNMNSTEYRKYMTTQKKLALSAAARQQQQQQQQQNTQVLGNEGPRTMSLQNNYTRSPYGMNSNMGGPSMKNGLGNIPGPAGGPTGFPNNMQMRNQQPWGQVPPMQQQQQRQPQQQQYGRPVDPRYRTMSLPGPGPAYGQLNQRRAGGTGMAAHGNVNSNENRNQWVASQPQFQQQQLGQGTMPGSVNAAQTQETFGVGNRAPYEAPLYRHSTNALPSYGNDNSVGVNAASAAAATTNTPTSMAGGRSTSMGNVETSAPYQQRAPIVARQQQQQQQQSQTEPARPAGKLNVLQLSTQQQQELEQRVQTDNLKGNDQSTVDLRPRSVLESGLQALSLDDTNYPSQTTTSASGLNEISEVKEIGTLQGNIHKMENGSGSSGFVTTDNNNNNTRNNLGTSSSRLNDESKRSSEPNIRPRSVGENFSGNPENAEVNGTSRVIRHSQTSNSSTGDVKLELSEISGTVDDTFGYKTSKVEDKQTSSSGDGIQNGSSSTTKGGVVDKLSGNNVNGDRRGGDDEFNFDNTVVMTYTDSLGRNIKALSITGERLGLLNENRSLMQDLTLVSMELAESLKRETLLSEQLRNSDASNASYEKKNQVSLTDFSEELRKKSSKIVELIQALNEERLKRFIAEEQVLLQEVNAKPNSLEFMDEIQTLRTTVKEKEADIAKLREELKATRR